MATSWFTSIVLAPTGYWLDWVPRKHLMAERNRKSKKTSDPSNSWTVWLVSFSGSWSPVSCLGSPFHTPCSWDDQGSEWSSFYFTESLFIYPALPVHVSYSTCLGRTDSLMLLVGWILSHQKMHIDVYPPRNLLL